MFGQGGKCPRIISGLNSARYRGQRSKPSPQHIHNRRILYIGELICMAEIEDCIRVVTHPKNLPLGACMIEAFIYPVPKGVEYEAPRMGDCHGPLRGPRNDGSPPPPPPPPRGGGGKEEGGPSGPALRNDGGRRAFYACVSALW